MATKDREYYRILVRDRFFKISAVIERAVKAKDVYRARVLELGNDLHRSTYSADHLAKLKQEAAQALAAVYAELYGEFTQRLEELKAALVEAHSVLDLQDPRLANATSLIRSIGPELGSETVQKINAQFAGDQSSLRVLRTAYKAAGVVWDGDLDKQVYDAEGAVRVMAEAGQNVLLGEGSINGLAVVVGRFAKLEGYTDFVTTPDPTGVKEAMYRGAGLPV